MVINIALWTDPGAVRRLRERPAQHLVQPVHQHLRQGRRDRSRRACRHGRSSRPWSGTVLIVGAVYYVVAQRGKLDAVQVEADAATGEATIG